MAGQPDISAILKEITSDVTTIVKGQIDLAKVELVPQAKSVGIGAGLFGGAGYLAANAAVLLFLGAAVGIGQWLSQWVGPLGGVALGCLIVALLLLLLAGVLALIGKGKVTVPGPKDTVKEAQESVDAVLTAVDRGLETAEAEAASRKVARHETPMLTGRNQG